MKWQFLFLALGRMGMDYKFIYMVQILFNNVKQLFVSMETNVSK
jgi:hypothetical protein